MFGVVFQGEVAAGDLARMRAIAPASVRYYINEASIQTLPGPCSPVDGASSCYWGYVDQMIGLAAASGAEPLPFVYGWPGYLSVGQTYPPVASIPFERGWTAVLRAMVDRYGSGGTYWRGPYQAQYPGAKPRPVRYWQVWNEPNSPTFFKPKPDVARYARLLHMSAAAIHGADPHARVVLAGLFSGNNKRKIPGLVPAVAYLQSLYRIPGIKSDFDVVALHPYARTAVEALAAVRQARSVMQRAGDARTPVWITEIGWSSNIKEDDLTARGENGQAQALTQAFRALSANRARLHLIGVDWYAFKDIESTETGNSFAWTGLYRTDGSAKPALDSFTSFTG